MVSEAQVLNTLSNDKSLTFFDAIALEGGDWSKLNRREYYSRISALIKSGLVEKRNGKYYLTSVGEVALEARQLIGSAIKDYWRLEAITSIGLELPQQEHNQIIEALIDKKEIKELLLKRVHDAVTKRNQQQKNTHAT
jgi:hypothetical protein